MLFLSYFIVWTHEFWSKQQGESLKPFICGYIKECLGIVDGSQTKVIFLKMNKEKVVSIATKKFKLQYPSHIIRNENGFLLFQKNCSLFGIGKGKDLPAQNPSNLFLNYYYAIIQKSS